MRKERGLHELYSRDFEKADFDLWGRRADPATRRGFLKQSGLIALSAALGASIPFARNMPAGLIPAAFAGETEPFVIPGKEELRVLNDRPINAEALPHQLNDDFTPFQYMFIRNNGITPDPKSIDPGSWTLTIDGEVERPTTFSIADLKGKFPQHTLALVIECAGNGRVGFQPPAKGNQFTFGAVHCAQWTGVRLRDVLESCGVKKSAVYTGFYGKDAHLSGEEGKVPISRGTPMAKALENESLLAWACNGEDIPLENGYPLRLITSGWPGSTSGKWLHRIWIRDRVHDGPKMTGHSYRAPCNPVPPGTDVPEESMCILETMPVKSLITHPRSGVKTPLSEVFRCNGHAWAGDGHAVRMEVSIDFGATWIEADLKEPVNRLAWQNFGVEFRFPRTGYYEVWAKATDQNGVSQPMVIPGWNPEGYMNNSCHRIAVYVV
jgi:DMSO/TMAO reductase YedYZ molybdopterin-dependent catalytic subunit